MFADVGAWHPLGIVVKGAQTPTEARKLGGIDWLVVQDKLISMRNGLVNPEVVENYRSDNGESLGVVGAGFQPVQNFELSDAATEIVSDLDGVEACVETCGSVLGGKRVWFCIRTADFKASPKDVLRTYLMLANGHDGSLAASFFFTSIRVVCHNTFKMSLSSAESMIRFRHEGDVQAKLEAAKQAIVRYAKFQKTYQESIEALSNRRMTADEIKDWIAEALTITEGDLVSEKDAKTSARKAGKRERQIEAFRTIIETFKKEGDLLGVNPQSAWLVHNAHTRWLQHVRPVRSGDKDPAVIAEKRMASDLFGPIAAAKQKSWEMAMALVK
jgi:phage/plasmid-like protein (TIGR03299 family)